MRHVIPIVLILSLCPSVGLSGGKLIGNGGDGSPLGFSQIAKKAISEVRGFPELRDVDLNAILLRSKVVLSDAPIHANVDGVKRTFIAASYLPDTIVLYRSRWENMRNMPIKKAIALHTLLVLSGKESPGQYPISKRYLLGLGVRCPEEQGLCENSPVYHCTLFKNLGTDKAEDISGTSDPSKVNLVGFHGGRKEVLHLGEGSLKSEVFMDLQPDRSVFRIWMRWNGKVVNILQLDGDTLPRQIWLEWTDPETDDVYGTSCGQR